MLYEAIQLMKIDVGKQLACQIAEWDAPSGKKGEALYDSMKQPDHALIFYFPPQQRKQNLLIYRGKKTS